MKNQKLILIAVMAIVILIVGLQVTKETIPQDYISYWAFEEDVNDKAGINNCTIMGNAMIDYHGNTIEPVLIVNGTSWVDCGNNPVLNPTNALTISFWGYLDVAPVGFKFAFNKEDTTNLLGYGLYVRDSYVHPYIKVNNAWSDLASDTGIMELTWNHYVMVWDGTNLVLYKNNVFDGIVLAEGIFNPSDTVLQIGKEARTLNRNWVGAIGDFVIYNRALTEDEITKIYELQSPKYNV
jgi:hypothetical protein